MFILGVFRVFVGSALCNITATSSWQRALWFVLLFDHLNPAGLSLPCPDTRVRNSVLHLFLCEAGSYLDVESCSCCQWKRATVGELPSVQKVGVTEIKELLRMTAQCASLSVSRSLSPPPPPLSFSLPLQCGVMWALPGASSFY